MTATTVEAITGYGAQRKYSEKQVKSGLVKVTAWVPIADRDNILDYAEELREEHAHPKVAAKK